MLELTNIYRDIGVSRKIVSIITVSTSDIQEKFYFT